MSFKNLIIHSIAIISVFKINVMIRSALFLIVYFFLIHQNVNITMVIPVLLILTLMVSIFFVSKREDLNDLEKSLSNILKIDSIK